MSNLNEFLKSIRQNLSGSGRMCPSCGIAYVGSGKQFCEGCIKSRDAAYGYGGVASPIVWGTKPTLPHDRDADEETTETVVGPILAYRTWKLGDDGKLKSITANYEWQPCRPTAGRLHHGAFEITERFVGVYAYKEIFDAFTDDAEAAFGGVWLWGKVVEYTKGYRAEQAYPAFLYCIDDDVCDCAPFAEEEGCYFCALQDASVRFRVPLLIGPDTPETKTEELKGRLLFSGGDE